MVCSLMFSQHVMTEVHSLFCIRLAAIFYIYVYLFVNAITLLVKFKHCILIFFYMVLISYRFSWLALLCRGANCSKTTMSMAQTYPRKTPQVVFHNFYGQCAMGWNVILQKLSEFYGFQLLLHFFFHS